MPNEPPAARLESDGDPAPAPIGRARGAGWWALVVVALAMVVTSVVTTLAPKPAHSRRATPHVDPAALKKSSPLRLAASRVRSLLPPERVITLLLIVAYGLLGAGLAHDQTGDPLRAGIGACSGVGIALGGTWISACRLAWSRAGWPSRIQHVILGTFSSVFIAATCACVFYWAIDIGPPPPGGWLALAGFGTLLGLLTGVFYWASAAASRLADPGVASTVRVQGWGYLAAWIGLVALRMLQPQLSDSAPLISAAIGGASFGAIALAVRASEAVTHGRLAEQVSQPSAAGHGGVDRGPPLRAALDPHPSAE